LPEAVVRRIDAKILSLAHAPCPAEAVKLKGADALYRVRVGAYRIVELALVDAATGRPRWSTMRTLHTGTCSSASISWCPTLNIEPCFSYDTETRSNR